MRESRYHLRSSKVVYVDSHDVEVEGGIQLNGDDPKEGAL
jgi:hypothetical protein